ncbi:transmembrane protein, putative (macronuclear) [Tetrahymena thermophila SB210]|uniref:Transmembrane protein, putative n=1 Tax=Tetrahymena thermophila (strain SB210) TaxID=312017 RepID=W7XI65_TETTS|nr:transmembrane protein, putative [Tetrahymena thermophila SB210]EWS73044.1 transmembrane protein, putative [Tetrahymena thermophila SB210]|eukprot:XP_012654441.1 transmembrane protein, putative [Tetrahymena thermophila SB210]
MKRKKEIKFLTILKIQMPLHNKPQISKRSSNLVEVGIQQQIIKMDKSIKEISIDILFSSALTKNMSKKIKQENLIQLQGHLYLTAVVKRIIMSRKIIMIISFKIINLLKIHLMIRMIKVRTMMTMKMGMKMNKMKLFKIWIILILKKIKIDQTQNQIKNQNNLRRINKIIKQLKSSANRKMNLSLIKFFRRNLMILTKTKKKKKEKEKSRSLKKNQRMHKIWE